MPKYEKGPDFLFVIILPGYFYMPCDCVFS